MCKADTSATNGLPRARRPISAIMSGVNGSRRFGTFSHCFNSAKTLAKTGARAASVGSSLRTSHGWSPKSARNEDTLWRYFLIVPILNLLPGVSKKNVIEEYYVLVFLIKFLKSRLKLKFYQYRLNIILYKLNL